jgi:hypothetical protein
MPHPYDATHDETHPINQAAHMEDAPDEGRDGD